MKIICAGLSKTGTKSMQAALKELGYKVYDFEENYLYLKDYWTKIMTRGGTTDDFREMFKNVDAVTDVPGCNFWDEIHKAFPESKIILTMRDDEDAWVESLQHQLEESNNPLINIMYHLSPTFMKLKIFGDRTVQAAFGTTANGSLFKPMEFNMTMARMSYRRHNAHVLQNAPRDKLLVFNVKQGWEPLCKFLQLPTPLTPFPHKNVKGAGIKEDMESHPMFIRGKREVVTSIALLLLLFLYLFYQLICLFEWQ